MIGLLVYTIVRRAVAIAGVRVHTIVNDISEFLHYPIQSFLHPQFIQMTAAVGPALCAADNGVQPQLPVPIFMDG